MFESDWMIGLTRLMVIVAACFAVVPLVRRSTRRRLTCEALVGGIVLALIPSSLNFLRTIEVVHLGASLTMLARMDAPGFAMILFGVVLGLRDTSRDKARLQKENLLLQREASTDFLTGLLNRREAESLLDYAAQRVSRSRDPLGFIMVDLDHFKRVNDTLGHQAGDAVLAHVAKLLARRTRTGDVVARYGGEEFLLVVAEPNPEVIVAMAEDLCRLIENTPTEFGGRQIPVTASFGVAVCLPDGKEAVDDGISKADAALYGAKALGRNQVVSWDRALQETDESAKALVQRAYAAKRQAA